MFSATLFVPSTQLSFASINEICSAANLVSETNGAIAFNVEGSLIGGFEIPLSRSHDDSLLPEGLSSLAPISMKGLVLHFSEPGRIHMLSQGQRVLLRRDIGWHLQAGAIKNAVDELAREYNIDKLALKRSIQLAYELSHRGLGALLTLGDHVEVLKYGSPLKGGSIRWKTMNIRTDRLESIVALACQDGATVISGSGEVLQGQTTIHPPQSTEVEMEVGRGSRHSTAAKISKITKAVVFAVSVDGRITVYTDGVIKFKVMG